MRTEFGYAWGKLYLAMLAMATSTAPLPQRVAEAFRTHLASLGRQNLPDFALERLTAMRAKFSTSPLDADDVIFTFSRMLDDNNPWHKVAGASGFSGIGSGGA